MSKEFSDYQKQHRAWVERNPLRQWRKARSPQIGVISMASMLDVTTSSIQAWENGTNNPGLEHLANMARIMGYKELADVWVSWREQKPPIPKIPSA